MHEGAHRRLMVGELHPADASRFAEALALLPSPYGGIDGNLPSILHPLSLLPARALDCLFRLRARWDAPGALLLRGLGVGKDLPGSPTHGGRVHDKPDYVSEWTVLSVAALLGEPFGEQGERRGELISNVVAVVGNEETESSEGATRPLRLHNENVFRLAGRPDWVVLLCLRTGAGETPVTVVSDGREAARLMSGGDLRELRKPQFCFHIPPSFQIDGGQRGWSAPAPALSGPEHAPELMIDFTGWTSLTDAGKAAMGRFSAALHHADAREDVRLAAGDLLVLDNRKVCHGRTAYEGSASPAHRRWLQRCLARRDLWPLRQTSARFTRVVCEPDEELNPALPGV